MKKTYKQNRIVRSQLKSVKLNDGMTMETNVALWLKNQNESEEQKEMVYTERKDGINQGMDIRSDRFDIAIDAMDKSAKSIKAKRDAKMNVVKDDEDSKGDSVQGTENK